MSALGRWVAMTAHVAGVGFGGVVHVQREKTTAAKASPTTEREEAIAREVSKPRTSARSP